MENKYSTFKLQLYLVKNDQNKSFLLQITEISIKETNTLYYLASPIRYIGDFQSKKEYHGEGDTVDKAIQDCISKIGTVAWGELFVEQTIQALSPEQITVLKNILLYTP